MAEDPAESLGRAFDLAIAALNVSARGRYAVIGGFAVACHGLPRATEDLDFLISVPRVSLPGMLEALHQRGFAFDMRQTLKELGADHMSCIRQGDVRVDLLEAVLPVFRRAVDRALTLTIRESEVRVASPEDLIVLKLIASRPRDLEDVRGILAAKGKSLNVQSIRHTAGEVCDEEALHELERLIEQAALQAPPR